MLRRESLKYLTTGSLLLLSGLLKPVTVFAKWNQAAFTAVDFNEAVSAYFPDQQLQETDKITIGVHPVVENGAVVPVKVNTSLANPESITIFVDKNPNPLIANFDLFPGCVGFISTRIKIQEPSYIVVTVKAEGSVYTTKIFVEVHEGGCG